jgi:hypothetical protein
MYEIDWQRTHPNHHYEMIAILTGLSFEEIIDASPKYDRWYGRDFVKTFQKLGFNTNERFVKFHPATDKPCMLRLVDIDKTKSGWYAWAYCDGLVADNGSAYNLELWKTFYPDLRITSMLQVWI